MGVVENIMGKRGRVPRQDEEEDFQENEFKEE